MKRKREQDDIGRDGGETEFTGLAMPAVGDFPYLVSEVLVIKEPTIIMSCAHDRDQCHRYIECSTIPPFE
jgi:hypothetical protein